MPKPLGSFMAREHRFLLKLLTLSLSPDTLLGKLTFIRSYSLEIINLGNLYWKWVEILSLDAGFVQWKPLRLVFSTRVAPAVCLISSNQSNGSHGVPSRGACGASIDVVFTFWTASL